MLCTILLYFLVVLSSTHRRLIHFQVGESIKRIHTDIELAVTQELATAFCVSIIFDLWMGAQIEEIMSVICYYVADDWEVRELQLDTLSFARVRGSDMGPVVLQMLQKYKVEDKVVAYVKDGGGNLDTTSNFLDSGGVGAKSLGIKAPFRGNCLPHALNGAGNKAQMTPTTTFLILAWLKRVSSMMF